MEARVWPFLAFLILPGFSQTARATSPPQEERTIEVGETVSGVLGQEDPTLEGRGPSQRFVLIAEEGPVTIALESYDFDAFLRAEDSSGVLLAEDDEGGVETNARLVLTDFAEGSCWIVVASKHDGGAFELSVRAGEVTRPSGAALLDAAIEYRVTAAERALARGDKKEGLHQRLEEANRRYESSHYLEAEEAYKASLTLANELRDREGEAAALCRLGSVYYHLDDYPRAREHCEGYLAIVMMLGDRRAEARVLSNLGIVYRHLGEYVRAREHHERSLTLSRQLGYQEIEVKASGNLGNVYFLLGEYKLARVHHEQSLALARKLGDRMAESLAHASLGNVHHQLGEFALAREHYQQHFAFNHDFGDQGEEQVEVALGNLGIVYLALGECVLAQEHCERQLALARDVGDRTGECRALGNLGAIYLRLGNYTLAREYIEAHVALSRSLVDRSGEEVGLSNLGSLHFALGDYGSAREYHEASLTLAREIGHRASEAADLGNLGRIYFALGEEALARDYHERHLALARELGALPEQATALENLGAVCCTQGEYGLALEYHEQSLRLARELGTRLAEATALESLGALYFTLGDYGSAREYHEQSLALARELDARAEEAAALGSLGAVYLALNERAHARQLAEQAEALARVLGQNRTLVHALQIKGQSCLDLCDTSCAFGALDEAERLLEQVLSGALEINERTSARERFAHLDMLRQDVVALRVREAKGELVVRTEAIAGGFAAAGRWKGRGLLEGIAEHRAGARSAEALKLRRERREALASHEAILRRVSNAIQQEKPSEELELLRGEARAKLALAEEIAGRVRDISPRDAAFDLPLGLSPEKVRSAVLEPGTLLIEYVEGMERLYAYVLGEEDLNVLELGKREEIEAELERFLAGIREGRNLAGVTEVHDSGKALFERLIAPALALAEEPLERLLIVPSASLAALPFEALVVGRTGVEAPKSFDELVFVLDRWEASYGPSSPVLVEIAQAEPRGESGKVLLLADPCYASEPAEENSEASLAMSGDNALRSLPDPREFSRLPETREEALGIAELLLEGELALQDLRTSRSHTLETARFDLHLGERASRARLTGDLRGYSILHFACHGYVDAELPQRTGIALAFAEGDDGYLTIEDVLELDLDAELVVLSACDTAKGRVLRGEGIESLARAFMYAGARGVIASQWRVADWAAAETMTAFYRGVLKEGLSASSALHAAKLALRSATMEELKERGLGPKIEASAEPPTAQPGHPYFWAPFIHLGLAR